MKIDSAVIPHHQLEVVPFESLKGMIMLNNKYLNEKKTWYLVDRELSYFKVRDDLRLFTELFFQEFARETIDLDTLTYELAYIKDVAFGQAKDESTLGLLSKNFQTPDKNYYLASELLDSKNSDLCKYGGFNLVDLLRFFKDYVVEEEFEIIKDYLVRLFIVDGFLLQVDRNVHNIGFEIPSIKGVPHTKRLRPYILEKDSKLAGYIERTDLGSKLIGLKPSKVYDNERIFNIDHNNVFLNNKESIWTPLFPYNEHLQFQTIANATQVSKEEYEGFDPNLLELYMGLYDESKKYIDRLAYDDIYRKILENYSNTNSPIFLEPSERKKIECVIKKRQKAFKQIIKLGS
jgi:hypothetical protein